jgi:hypothetical protein
LKTNLEIEEILSRLKEALELSSDAQLSRFLEVSKSTLSNWKKRGSIDYDLVFTKCEHLSKDWLLSGHGTQNIADVIAGNMSGQTVVDNSMGKVNIGKGKVGQYNVVTEGNAEYGNIKAENKKLKKENKELQTKVIRLEGQVELLTSLLQK